MLSLLGVSVGFVIAFLGTNTSEVLGVGQQMSMWDARFASLYLVASLFALTPAYFICLPYLRDWMRPRRRNDVRGFTAGLFIAACGVGVVWLANQLSLTASYNGIAIAVDAILKALGFFGIAVGGSLVVFWLWNRSRTSPA